MQLFQLNGFFLENIVTLMFNMIAINSYNPMNKSSGNLQSFLRM